MATVTQKECNRCKEMLPAEDFYRLKASPDGLQYTCKACQSKYRSEVRDPDGSKGRQKSAEWKLSQKHSDPEGYARRQRSHNLMKLYGITVEVYEAMLEKQGGLCLCCGRPETALRACGTTQNLSVDHCHRNGHVRGLLCRSCNTALGMVDDNIDLLNRLIAYVEGDDVSRQ